MAFGKFTCKVEFDPVMLEAFHVILIMARQSCVQQGLPAAHWAASVDGELCGADASALGVVWFWLY